MASITLTASLFDLVPDQERAQAHRRRTLPLSAQTWPEATAEMRNRFPDLAQRILTETGAIAEGFLLAVNGALLGRDQSPRDLAATDELHLIAQMAGG